MGKLIPQAGDTHASDTYYHVQCYLHLGDSARTANHRASFDPAQAQFDPVATAHK